jgi:hypothetical protein
MARDTTAPFVGCGPFGAELRRGLHESSIRSHVELDQEFAVLFLLREEKLRTVHAFLGWRSALEAAGLSV